jgi:hypothetical protein
MAQAGAQVATVGPCGGASRIDTMYRAMSATLTTPVVLDQHRSVAVFAASLEDRIPLVVEEAVARQRAAVPELGPLTDSDLVDVVAQALSVGVELAIVAMRSPAAAPREVPDALARLTAIAARHEIALPSVLRMLRATHAVLLDHILAHADATGVPLEIVEIVSRHLFWYMDVLVPLVSAEHEVERERIGSRPESARAARIRAVLDGADRLDLRYPLNGSHVAIVLRGTKARALLRSTLERIGVPALATEAPDGTLWAWLSCGLCEQDVVAALREDWDGSCFVGVSGHESGVAGFRATHRKAWMALQLGRRRGSNVTTFGDIALEALAFGGEQMAREFVRAEMEPLLDDAPRVVAVRETLAAYFTLGSAAAAGRQLGVSERAIIYRLRHAERMLQRPLTTRRAELETALRLHGMFAAARSRAAAAAAA